MRRSRGSWRSVIVWATIILIATSLPASGLVLRSQVPWLDKAVHAVLYGVLGWLVGATLRGSGRRGWQPLLVALLGIALFAAADEAHQSWLPGRVTSVLDWTADVVGAIVGLVVGASLAVGERDARDAQPGPDNRGGAAE